MPVRCRSLLALFTSTLIAGILAACILGIGLAPQADADLTICNQTDQPVGVAIATRIEVVWKSDGWWTVEPGRCKAVLKGHLTGTDYFLHALHYNVGGRWEGTENFCIDRGSFSIEGRHDCDARGFASAGFLRIETKGKPDWQHTLGDDAAKPAHGEIIQHSDPPKEQQDEQPIKQPQH